MYCLPRPLGLQLQTLDCVCLWHNIRKADCQRVDSYARGHPTPVTLLNGFCGFSPALVNAQCLGLVQSSTLNTSSMLFGLTQILNRLQPYKMRGRSLKKLNIELPWDFSNRSNSLTLILSTYPKITEAGVQADVCVPTFIMALSTAAKRWKEPKHPWTGEWINKR